MISSNSSAEETGEAVPETVAPDPAPRPSRRSFTALSVRPVETNKRHTVFNRILDDHGGSLQLGLLG